MNFDSLREDLLSLSTAAICDANKGTPRAVRVVDPAIRPLCHGAKLVGRAHTVSCYEDFLTVIKALNDAVAGEVLVIDSCGSKRAVSGGLFPVEAKRKGLGGIIVDGSCRDTADIRALGFPYYARGASCYAATTNRLFATQIPVTCGGVVVNQGDILFGDDDGIVVGTLEEFEALLEKAKSIVRTEATMLKQMAHNRSLLSMMNFTTHCQDIAAGRPSKLEFLVE